MRNFSLSAFCFLLLLGPLAAISQKNKPLLDSLKRTALLHLRDTLGSVCNDELCYQYRFINQDSALAFGKLAIAQADEIGFEKGGAQAYSDVGVIYYDKGDLTSAEASWNQSLKIRERRKDSLKIAGIHISLGALYFRKGDYNKSLQHQLSALHIYENKKFESGTGYALNNAAAVYEQQGQLDKALDFYTRSYRIKEKLKDLNQVAQTLINIANVHYSQKNFLLAKQEYLLAIRYFKDQPASSDYNAIAYNNISELYRVTGNYDSALLMTNKALAMREEIHDFQGFISSLNSKGAILAKMKRYDEAKKYLLQAFDSATAEKLEPERQKIAMNLHDLYEASGNTIESFKYFKLSTAIKDSLFNESSRKNINELQVKYDTEQKESQILEQKALVARTELRLVLVGSILLVIVITGSFIYKSQLARRRKTEQETRYKLQLAEARLEKELQEDRLRISRELHDNIGSRLLFLSSAVSNLGGNEKAVELSTFARSTLHELRRTVWLINNDTVTLEDLQVKFNEYFGFLQQTTPLNIQVSLVGDPSIAIRSPKAAAIFRVAQEAVSNVVKHAAATKITLVLSTALPGKIRLSVEDNGHGFDASIAQDGNGLKNMKVHAAQMHGDVTLDSGTNGTQIILTFPI